MTKKKTPAEIAASNILGLAHLLQQHNRAPRSQEIIDIINEALTEEREEHDICIRALKNARDQRNELLDRHDRMAAAIVKLTRRDSSFANDIMCDYKLASGDGSNYWLNSEITEAAERYEKK